MRGRKPKPSYLRALDGNAGRRPENPDEPQPKEPLKADEPPPWMDGPQAAAWRYAMEHAPAGMLRSLDQSVLAAWVVAQVLHADAATRVQKLGSILRSKEGQPYHNPWMAVMNKQAMIMMKAAAELGFTPSSRSRVKVDNRKPGDRNSNPYADLRTLDD
jgi:phage terminase, small subunit, putative, P27 family